MEVVMEANLYLKFRAFDNNSSKEDCSLNDKVIYIQHPTLGAVCLKMPDASTKKTNWLIGIDVGARPQTNYQDTMYCRHDPLRRH